MSFLSIPGLIAVVIAFPTLLWLYSLTLGRNKRLPPSPPSLPLLGSLHVLFPYIRVIKMYKFSELYHVKLGKIFFFSVFNKYNVSVADARCGKEILTTDKFVKDEQLRTMFKGMGLYQLFTIPSGEVWQKHRKYMQPSFGPSHQQNALALARDVTLQLVEVLNRLVQDNLKSAGKSEIFSDESAPVVNLYKCFSGLTLDVIGLLAFSHAFKMVPSLMDPVADKPDLEAFENILTVAAKRFGLPHFLWKYYKVSEQDMKSDADKIRGIIIDVIASKRKKIAQRNYDDAKLDMLERLIEATNGKAEVSFTEEELVDEILAIFGAGSETTSNTLTCCIMALCQNPHVYAKLQAAIDEAFPNPDDLPTWDKVQKLGYLDLTIRETLRLYPVVGIVTRVSTQQVPMMGYVIPSGTQFMVNIREIHHNAEYWPEPLKFDPDRWETGKTLEPGVFLPFGDGPMNCIGQKIAMVETKTVLCILLKKFRFVLVPCQDLEPIQTITIGLKHGLKVHVIPRAPLAS